MEKIDKEKMEALGEEFNFPVPQDIQNPEIALKLFEERLALAIEKLLHHQKAKVINFLYRIDVHETLSREALRLTPRSKAAQRLARLIVERQLRKLQTQK